MASSESYVFPGVSPFVDAEARRLGLDGRQVGPASSLWHVARIQDALGQLPSAPAESRPEVLEHVRFVRDSLALALAAADAAIADALAGVGGDGVDPETEPKSKKSKGR